MPKAYESYTHIHGPVKEIFYINQHSTVHWRILDHLFQNTLLQTIHLKNYTKVLLYVNLNLRVDI